MRMDTAIFSFGCKIYKQSGSKGGSPTVTPIRHKFPDLESENIREPILDITVLLGEIPRHTFILVNILPKEFFHLFSRLKKSDKTSIFLKPFIATDKTRNFSNFVINHIQP